jgi:hypothetical protein
VKASIPTIPHNHPQHSTTIPRDFPESRGKEEKNKKNFAAKKMEIERGYRKRHNDT